MRGSPCATHGAVQVEDHGVGDMRGCAAGKVELADDEGPAVRVPGPTGDRLVNDGGPDDYEDHEGTDFVVLRGSANSDDGAREPGSEPGRGQ